MTNRRKNIAAKFIFRIVLSVMLLLNLSPLGSFIGSPPIALAEEEAATLAEIVIESEETNIIEGLVSGEDDDGHLTSPSQPESASVLSTTEYPSGQDMGDTAVSPIIPSEESLPELSSEETAQPEQPLPAPAPTPISEDLTNQYQPKGHTWETVELNKTYVYPYNDQVGVSFTKLPEVPGTVTIEEVTLSDLQVKSLGAYSSKAYDVRSSMENGSFEYMLKLPLPGDASANTEVVFAESVAELDESKTIDSSKISMSGDMVTISDLDHFTVFVVVYDSMPVIMPGSSPSLGYQATSTSEFGDHLTLAGVERNAARVTVELNSWACQNDFALIGDLWVPDRASTEACETTPGSNYEHPITLNVYSVDTSGPVPAPNTLVASKTIMANVPFRPSYDATLCADLASNTPFGGRWFDPDTSSCSNGYNFDLAFDFDGEELPDQIITTVAFNTQSYGTSPIGINGPYNSLNFSVPNVTPSVGLNLNPDDVFWKTAQAGNYTDGGTGGVNVLRQDTSWAGYVPMIRVETATPTVTTIVIPKDNVSWQFNRDLSTASPYEMTTDKAKIGTGSLKVLPIGSNASDKFIAEDFIRTPIAEINKITYDFMIGPGGEASDANQFYMNIYANFGVSPVDKFYDCRYTVAPAIGSLSDFTTVTFDPTVAHTVAQSGSSPFTCPAIPADMNDQSEGSLIRVYSLNVGDTSASDLGLDGYLDNVVVDKGLDVTIYDFEPIPVPVVTIDDSATRIIDNQACGLGAAWDDDGLKVDIENWAPGYKLMGRYFTQGGSFVGWFDLSTWAPIVVSGDDASFFASNSGNSVPGNAGWEVKVVDENDLDISNVDTLSYYITTNQSSAACGGVQISLCKEDSNGQPLSGWELILSGREEFADTTLNTLHSSGVTIPGLTSGNFYQVEVSGQWNNGNLETRDAFYGAMGPNTGNLDPINTGVYDPRIVKVVLDDEPSTLIDFPSWWGPYAATSTYSTIYEATDSDLNVRLWDFPIGSSDTSWYNDNNGQLNVKVYKLTNQKVTTTGENGCGTIQGVVGGQHYLSELPQTNWQYLSGGGDIEIDEQSTEFTIINRSLIPVVQPELANVTVCKEDTHEARLPGWQVQLYKTETSQSQFVTATSGVATALTDVLPGNYILRATGHYTYRGTPGAEYSDAGWSKRDVGDAVYGGASVPWVNVMSFPNPNTGWLGVMVNGDSNWGAYFSPSHIYARSLDNFAGGDIALQILDDQYGDNVGGVNVALHEGYTGVTGENGCVTFADVPYGEYQLDETMMAGWDNQSGIGSVVVDAVTETFTLLNASTQITEPTPTPTPSPSPTPTPTPTPQSVVLSASKVLCESEADLPDGALGGAITATTAQEWVNQSDENCELVTEWPFQWSPAEGGLFGSFQTDTASLSEPWQSFAAGNISIPLTASTSGRIEVREVFPEDENDYIPFTNDNSVSAQLACTGDGSGYDNWEWINAPQAGQTYHCVAFNALVAENTEPTPSPSAEPTPTPEPQLTGSVLGTSSKSSGTSSKASPPDCSEFNPSTPLALSAIATGGSVSLIWSDIPEADSYVLRVLPPGGSEYGLQDISGDTNALTLTNLNIGTYTFEVWGQDNCHPSPRAAATATIITTTFGEGTGGPIAVLPGGEEVPLEEGSVEGASDELSAEEIAALENQKGLVAGLTDETCQRNVTPWLPVIFLAIMGVLALLIEIIMRSPSIVKIFTLVTLTAAGILLFYWLRNCDCLQGGETLSQLLSWLCQWFWVAASLLALLLRGVGFSFIQSEDD